MIETSITVAEAAHDFLRVLDLVERKHETAILVRDGKPVASLHPISTEEMTCAKLAKLWPRMKKLSPEEANAFADDLEDARAKLPPLKSAWD